MTLSIRHTSVHWGLFYTGNVFTNVKNWFYLISTVLSDGINSDAIPRHSSWSTLIQAIVCRVAQALPETMLIDCQSPRNTFQWNFGRNSNSFTDENALENDLIIWIAFLYDKCLRAAQLSDISQWTCYPISNQCFDDSEKWENNGKQWSGLINPTFAWPQSD